MESYNYKRKNILLRLSFNNRFDIKPLKLVLNEKELEFMYANDTSVKEQIIEYEMFLVDGNNKVEAKLGWTLVQLVQFFKDNEKKTDDVFVFDLIS